MPPTPNGQTPSPDQDPLEATLVFHEQADGRKVARLPGGKVVLIDLKAVDRVGDGEAWFVRLRHRELFAIAEPIERVTRAAWFPRARGDAPSRRVYSARATRSPWSPSVDDRLLQLPFA